MKRIGLTPSEEKCVLHFLHVVRSEDKVPWTQHIRHYVVFSLVTVCPSQLYVHCFLGLRGKMICSSSQRTATRPGLEPGTSWSVVHDANHCASPLPRRNHLKTFTDDRRQTPDAGCLYILLAHLLAFDSGELIMPMSSHFALINTT